MQLKGELPAPDTPTPTIQALLTDLNHPIQEIKKNTKQATPTISKEQYDILISTNDIRQNACPIKLKLNRVREKRNHHMIMWRSKKLDIGKRASNCKVCWLSKLTPFEKYATVDDIGEVHFGDILNFGRVYIEEGGIQTLKYVIRVQVHKVDNYVPGTSGMWKCSTTTAEQIVPLDSISEPLIYANTLRDDVIESIMVLNSKVKLSPVEARFKLKHIGI